MSQPHRIRVAIVGAGIAGLVLALALITLDEDDKIAIDVYDAVSELTEIGAGINLWPRTLQIFREIGLAEALIPYLDQYPDLEPRVVFEIRKADQKDGFKIRDVVTKGGALRIHRADLQRCLMQRLPIQDNKRPKKTPFALHLSHRLVDYTSDSSSQADPNTGPVTLHFANQPSRTCDILVGADGIKSTIRGLFLQRLGDQDRVRAFTDPVWSGAVAYRGLIATEELAKAFPGHRALSLQGIMYMGKNNHTVVYPVARGEFINVVAAKHDLAGEGTRWEGPWNIEVTQREFMDQFIGWEDEFQALIKCIERPTKWALHNMPHLDIFARGRVLLMGDAAHAMVPYQGAGAGTGIEDAFVLASLLTNPHTPRSPSPQFIHHLLDVYDRVCVPHAIKMSKISIHQGHLYTIQTPVFEQYKEGEPIPLNLLQENFREAEDRWFWTVADPGENRRKAVGLLQSIKARL